MSYLYIAAHLHTSNEVWYIESQPYISVYANITTMSSNNNHCLMEEDWVDVTVPMMWWNMTHHRYLYNVWVLEISNVASMSLTLSLKSVGKNVNHMEMLGNRIQNHLLLWLYISMTLTCTPPLGTIGNYKLDFQGGRKWMSSSF